MDLGTQQAENVDTKQVKPRLKKTFLIKFRLDAQDNYLLKQELEKAGNVSVSLFFRRLLKEAPKVRQSAELVEAFKTWQANGKNLEAIIELT